MQKDSSKGSIGSHKVNPEPVQSHESVRDIGQKDKNSGDTMAPGMVNESDQLFQPSQRWEEKRPLTEQNAQSQRQIESVDEGPLEDVVEEEMKHQETLQKVEEEEGGDLEEQGTGRLGEEEEGASEDEVEEETIENFDLDKFRDKVQHKISITSYNPEKAVLNPGDRKKQSRSYQEVESRAVAREGKGDVYPLSVVYTKKEKATMMVIRLVLLVLLIIFLVPKDFIAPSLPYVKLTYIDTQTVTEKFKFEEIDSEFTLDTLGCDIEILNLDSAKTDFFKITTTFGIFIPGPKTNQDSLRFENTDPDLGCDVKVYLPEIVPTNMVFKVSKEDLVFFRTRDLEKVIQFEKRLQITGVQVDLTLQTMNLNELIIDIEQCDCSFANLAAKSKKITVDYGQITDNISVTIKQVNVFSQQTYGLICNYAPFIKDSKSEGQCPSTQAEREAPLSIVKNAVDPDLMCKTNVTLCHDSACTSDESEIQNIQVLLRDGPIQIGYADDPPEMTYSHLRSFQSYNVESQMIQSERVRQLRQDSENDFIEILSITSNDYFRNWVYTNRFPYIQAQVWPISAVSFGILKPQTTKTRLFISDSQCPGRTIENNLRHEQIKDQIQTAFPDEPQSEVVYVNDVSSFWIFKKKSNGQFLIEEITFGYNNKLIIPAFAVSAVLAVFGSIILIGVLINGVQFIQMRYDKFIDEQRNFAKVKKMQEADSSKMTLKITKAEIMKQVKRSNEYVEVRGIFTNSFVTLKSVLNSRSDIDKESLDFSLSFFEGISQFVDYSFRQRTNSIDDFLQTISISDEVFTERRLNILDFIDSSIQLNEFKKKYSEFCLQNGLKLKDLQTPESEKIYDKFSLKLVWKWDNSSKTFLNIRFKNQQEKEQSIEKVVSSKNDAAKEKTAVEMFLDSECVATGFESDKLILQDLEEAYEEFLRKNEKLAKNYERLQGSKAFDNFGAKLGGPSKVWYLKGVMPGYVKGADQKSMQIGLIRRPIYLKSRNQTLANRFARYKRIYFTEFFLKVMKSDGFVAIFLSVIVNFFVIILIPAPFVITLYFILAERTQFGRNFGDRYFEITDLLRPEADDNWWEGVPYAEAIIYSAYGIAIYLFFAFFELISFYSVGYDNAGKFLIVKTWQKMLLQRIFYFFLLVFCIIYFVVITIFMVWSILGAILNPAKYLPYASASVTMIMFLRSKMQSISDFQNMIYEKLDEVVQKKIMSKAEKQINRLQAIGQEKLQGKIQAIASHASDKLGFQKSILKKITIDPSKTSLNDVQAMLEGDTQAIAKVLSQQVGINQNFISFAINCMQKNEKGIIQDIGPMAKVLGLDPELLISFVQILQQSYKMRKTTLDKIQKVDGQLILQVKNFFKVLFEDLDLEIVDGVIAVATQGDPTPLVELFEDKLPGNQQICYPEIFKILIAVIMQDRNKIYANIKEFLKNQIRVPGIQPEMLEKLVDFIKLIEGSKAEELRMFFEPYLQYLGFRNVTGFFALMCFTSKNIDLQRDLMEFAIRGMFTRLDTRNFLKDREKMHQIQGCITQVVDSFLTFHQISNGNDINIKELCEANEIDCNVERATDFDEVCSGNFRAFVAFVNALKLSSSKEILQEYYRLAFYKITSMELIGYKLKLDLPQEMTTVKSLIQIYRNLIHFDFQVQKLAQWTKKTFSKKAREARDQGENLEVQMEQKKKYNAFDNKIKKMKKRIVESYKMFFKVGVLKNESEEETLNQVVKNIVEEALNIAKVSQYMIAIMYDQELPKPHHFIFYQNLLSEPKIKQMMTPKLEKKIASIALTLFKCFDDIEYQNKVFQKSIKKVAKIFDVDQFKFELLIDIINGDPVNIFRCKNPEVLSLPKDQRPLLQLSQSRIAAVASALESRVVQIRKLATLWINQYQLIYRAKTNQNKFVTENLGINSGFTKILEDFRNQTRFDQTDGESHQKLAQNMINFALDLLAQEEKVNQEEREEQIRSFKSEFELQNASHQDNSASLSDYIEGIEREQRQRNQESLRLQEEEILTNNHTVTNNLNQSEENQLIVEEYGDLIQKLKEFQLDKKQVYQRILKLRKLDSAAIQNFLGISGNKAKGLTELVKRSLRFFAYPYPNQLISLLQCISQQIPLLEEFEDSQFDLDTDNEREFDQYLMQQFVLITNAIGMKTFMKDTMYFKPSEFNTQVEVLIALANEVISDSFAYKNGERVLIQLPPLKDKSQLLPRLFDEGYFRILACKIFEYPGISEVYQENLLGIIFGLMSDETVITRQCFTKILKDEFDEYLSLGLVGILLKDLTAEKYIMRLSQHLSLDGRIVMNLLELQDKVPTKVASACQELIKGKSEKAEIISSLISIFRKDTNSSRPLADLIGVNYETFYQVLGATFEKKSCYHDLSVKLSNILRIKDSKSIEIIFKLARGSSQAIYQIAERSKIDFPIRNPQIIDSLIQISQKGKEAQKEEGKFLKDKNKLYFLSEYVEELYKIMDYTLKLDSVIEISNGFGKVKDLAQDRKNSLVQLTSVCWKDEKSLKDLASKLTLTAQNKKDNKVVSRIWKTTYQTDLLIWLITEKIQELIDKFDYLKNYKMKVRQAQKEYIKNELLPLLEQDMDQLPAHTFEQKAQKHRENLRKMKYERMNYDQITQDKSQNEKLASITGCTFSITLFEELHQPIFFCMKCAPDIKHGLGICAICAKTCHKGHKIVKANYGIWTKTVCDCGNGKIKKLNNNDKSFDCQQRAIYYDKIRKEVPGDGLKNFDIEENFDFLTFEGPEKEFKPEFQKKIDLKKYSLKHPISDSEFKEAGKQYSLEAFIYDLSEVLGFNREEFLEKIGCDFFKQNTHYLLSEERLKIYERSMDLEFDFISNWILLSSNRCNFSFLTLFSNVESESKIERYNSELYEQFSIYKVIPYKNSDFIQTAALMAMVQNDYDMLIAYADGLCSYLQISGFKDMSAADKVIQALTVIEGQPLEFLEEVNGDSTNTYCTPHYLEVFKELFGKKKGVIVNRLHSLLTMPKNRLIDLLNYDQEVKGDRLVDKEGMEYKCLESVKKVICKDFGFGNEDWKFFKNLLLASLGYDEAIRRILKLRGVQASQSLLYESLMSDALDETELFRSKMADAFPKDLLLDLSKICLNNSRSSFNNFAIAIALNASKNREFSWQHYNHESLAAYKNEVEENESGFGFSDRVNAFYDSMFYYGKKQKIGTEKLVIHLTKAEISAKQYKLRDADDIEPEMEEKIRKVRQRAKALISLSGLFTKNAETASFIFKLPKFELSVKQLVSIEEMTNVSTSKASFIEEKNFVQSVLQSILCEELDISQEEFDNPATERHARALSLQVMDQGRQVIKLSSGNLDALAAFSGEIAFNSQCGVYELLASLETKELNSKDLSKAEQQFFAKKWERDIIRLFERILKQSFEDFNSHLPQDDPFRNKFRRFLRNEIQNEKIPQLLALMLANDATFIESILDPYKYTAKDDASEVQISVQRTIANIIDPEVTQPPLDEIIHFLLEQLHGGQRLQNIFVTFDCPAKLNFLGGVENEKFCKIKERPAFQKMNEILKDKKAEFKILLDQIGFKTNGGQVKINLIDLFVFLYQATQFDRISVEVLLALADALLQNNPELQQAFSVLYSIQGGELLQALQNLPSIVFMLLNKIKVKQNLKMKEIDFKMGFAVVEWVQAFISAMDAEGVQFDKLSEQFSFAISESIEVVELMKLDGKNFKIFGKHSAVNISEILMGVLGVLKGNFEALTPLLLKIGAAPDSKVLKQIMKTLKKNKNLLINAVTNTEEIIRKTSQKAHEALVEGMGKLVSIGGMNVQAIFELLDKDGTGTISWSEFIEVCKLMEINISNDNLMRIFSAADKHGEGSLDMEAFIYAFFRLRLIVVYEALIKIGLTREEMMIGLVLSVLFLLVLFVFIFIGINAFSYANSFGSVINSILPAAAGAGVAQKGKKSEESLFKKLQDAVEEALDELKL